MYLILLLTIHSQCYKPFFNPLSKLSLVFSSVHWNHLIAASPRKPMLMVFDRLVLHRSRGPIGSARPAHGSKQATPLRQGMDIRHMEV